MQFATRFGSGWLSHLVARRTARVLQRRAQKMEIYAARLSDSVELFGESTTSWPVWMKTRGKAIQAGDFIGGINTMRAATASAIPNTRGFRDATDNNRGLSAEMDVAGGYVVAALDKVLAAMDRTIHFCDQISAEASSHQLTGKAES